MTKATLGGITAAALLALGVVGCSTEDGPAKIRRVGLKSLDVRDATLGAGDGASDDGDGDGSDGGGGGGSKLTTFKSTVFPVVRGHCASCHATFSAPFFAADDADAALAALEATHKVDLRKPELSRLYLRLAVDKHNCVGWDSCETGATEMLAAIGNWAARMDPSELPQDTPTPTTAARSFSDSEKREAESQNATNVIALEAESGVLKAPFRIVDQAGTSGDKVVDTPNGSGSVTNAQQAAMNNALGTILFDFEVIDPGTYRLIGSVNGASAAANSFYAKMDNGPLLPWLFTPNGNMFSFDVADPVDGAGTPHTFDLTAGMHRLEIRQREQTSRIDMVILTSDANLDPTTVKAGNGVREIDVLTFDLGEASGVPGAKLTMEVLDYSQNAYIFKNPTVTTDKALKLKGMRLLVNGTFLPQHATFLEIDKTIAAPGDVVSPAAMVVLKDKGKDEDKFTLQFSELGAAE